MKSKLLLWIGISSSIIFYTLAVVFELEIFEGFCELMTLFEAYELDEVVIPLLILNFFLIIYVVRIGRESSSDWKKSDIHLGRLKELSASSEVLATVLDKMHRLKDHATHEPNFDQHWVATLDQYIQDVVTSSDNLKNLQKAEEREIKKILKEL